MIERRSIETFLRVNGIPPTAKDEEIRSVLISARWSENEIDTALMVLKENTISKETHIDQLHKVFNSDSRLNSSEISSLLGIDVQISGADVGNLDQERKRSDRRVSLAVVILAIAIALGTMSYLMFEEKVGYFKEQR